MGEGRNHVVEGLVVSFLMPWCQNDEDVDTTAAHLIKVL